MTNILFYIFLQFYKLENFVNVNGTYVQVNANDPHKQLQLVRSDDSLDPWQFREVTI